MRRLLSVIAVSLLLLLTISCNTTDMSVTAPAVLEKTTTEPEKEETPIVPALASPVIEEVIEEEILPETPTPALPVLDEVEAESEPVIASIEEIPEDTPTIVIEEDLAIAEEQIEESLEDTTEEQEAFAEQIPIEEPEINTPIPNEIIEEAKPAQKQISKTIDKFSIELPIIQIACIVIAILAIAVGVAVSRKMSDNTEPKDKKKKKYETTPLEKETVKIDEPAPEIAAEPVVIKLQDENKNNSNAVLNEKTLNIDILIKDEKESVGYTLTLREESSINIKAAFPVVMNGFTDSLAFTYASIMKSAEKNADKCFTNFKDIYNNRALHFIVKCPEETQLLWNRAYELKNLTSFSDFERAFNENFRGERSIDSTLTFLE